MEKARALLLLAATWARECTLSVGAVVEELTAWPRSAVQLAATVNPPEFGATIGRTKT